MLTRRILKWSIPVDDHEHPVGTGAVVHVACQTDHRSVEVWTDELGDDDVLGSLPATTARVYATGQPITRGPGRVEVLGSAIPPDLPSLAWHVARRWPA